MVRHRFYTKVGGGGLVSEKARRERKGKEREEEEEGREGGERERGDMVARKFGYTQLYTKGGWGGGK